MSKLSSRVASRWLAVSHSRMAVDDGVPLNKFKVISWDELSNDWTDVTEHEVAGDPSNYRAVAIELNKLTIGDGFDYGADGIEPPWRVVKVDKVSDLSSVRPGDYDEDFVPEDEAPDDPRLMTQSALTGPGYVAVILGEERDHLAIMLFQSA